MTRVNIATNGIVFNEYTQVLLMQRDDTRTWALPGGMLDAGELPTDGVAREVREETGIIVMPVRLVGLYHVKNQGKGATLLFAFRCIQRGGKIQTSHESPQVGWFPTRPLPTFMLQLHRQRIIDAFHHQGGAPVLAYQQFTWLHRIAFFIIRNVYYRYKDWRRVRRGEAPYRQPPGWETAVSVVLHNQKGHVLWLQPPGQQEWRLPGGPVIANEAPWETAVRLSEQITGLPIPLPHLRARLSGVYLGEGNHLILNFRLQVPPEFALPANEGKEYAYFSPGSEPPQCSPPHRERVQDAFAPSIVTQFKKQPDLAGESW